MHNLFWSRGGNIGGLAEQGGISQEFKAAFPTITSIFMLGILPADGIRREVSDIWACGATALIPFPFETIQGAFKWMQAEQAE